jgi:hypothetical protein
MSIHFPLACNGVMRLRTPTRHHRHHRHHHLLCTAPLMTLAAVSAMPAVTLSTLLRVPTSGTICVPPGPPTTAYGKGGPGGGTICGIGAPWHPRTRVSRARDLMDRVGIVEGVLVWVVLMQQRCAARAIARWGTRALNGIRGDEGD